jgi:hypothetical protein
MSIFDRLHTIATGMVRADPFSPDRVIVRVEETDRLPMRGFNNQQQYCISLTVNQIFWANTAQYEYAFRQAEEMLAAFLYNDILLHLKEIEQATSDGDRDRIWRACGRIKKILIEGRE